MKRTITAVLFFALCLMLCACGHTPAPNPAYVSVPTPETTHDPAEILPDHNSDPDGDTEPDIEGQGRRTLS